ncbi:MAG: hypothetical protein JWL61_2304 [Gemmatimonadetes bacterium]|nr:hypothetical protein [Gemmatimonadota bacterium]
MPTVLLVQGNSFNYSASFGRPAFDLWGREADVLAGLYDVLHPFGVQLSDVSRLSTTTTSIAEHAVGVRLGERATLSLRLGKLDANVRNYVASDLDALANIVARVEEWLRVAVPGHTFGARVMETFLHSKLKDGSVNDLLQRVGPRIELSGAKSRGNGAMFHLEIGSYLADVVVDRSLSVADGLYVHFALSTASDEINHAVTLELGRRILNDVLGQLDLALAPQ